MNRPTDKQTDDHELLHRRMQNLWRNGLPQKKGTLTWML